MAAGSPPASAAAVAASEAAGGDVGDMTPDGSPDMLTLPYPLPVATRAGDTAVTPVAIAALVVVLVVAVGAAAPPPLVRAEAEASRLTAAGVEAEWCSGRLDCGGDSTSPPAAPPPTDMPCPDDDVPTPPPPLTPLTPPPPPTPTTPAPPAEAELGDVDIRAAEWRARKPPPEEVEAVGGEPSSAEKAAAPVSLIRPAPPSPETPAFEPGARMGIRTAAGAGGVGGGCCCGGGGGAAELPESGREADSGVEAEVEAAAPEGRVKVAMPVPVPVPGVCAALTSC